MTDGNTLIVDVVQKGDDYILNDTPVNMMIAYEVVRRHVTDSGTFYSQMTKKQKTAEGYSFVFDTGDVFESTSDTAYPTSATLNDAKPAELPARSAADKGSYLHVNESTGALEWAGNRFVVTFTQDPDTEEWSADKTFAECVAAWNAGKTLWAYDGVAAAYVPLGLVLVGENSDPYEFEFIVYYYDGIMVRTMYISTDGVEVIDEKFAPAE